MKKLFKAIIRVIDNTSTIKLAVFALVMSLLNMASVIFDIVTR